MKQFKRYLVREGKVRKQGRYLRHPGFLKPRWDDDRRRAWVYTD